MTRIRIIFLFLLFYSILSAQTVEEIKLRHELYLWGEGSGSTMPEANSNAMRDLVEQIYVQVKSDFEFLVEEQTIINQKENRRYEENVKSVIQSYSSATLHNTQRIIISNEPNAKVFRYIRKDEVDKVFESRKKRIIDNIQNADLATEELRIGQAVKLYYTALVLLKSHPQCNSMVYTDPEGNERLLINWLPTTLDRLFYNTSILISEIKKEENEKTIGLQIAYKGKPVAEIDFSYFNGREWSPLISARNGMALISYYDASANLESSRIRIEYLDEVRKKRDEELRLVMENIDVLPFPSSYFMVPHKDPGTVMPVSQTVEKQGQITKSKQTSGITEVIEGIRNRNYGLKKSLFTTHGYEDYQKILSYGNPRIVGEPFLTPIENQGELMVRGLVMQFAYSNNNIIFTEEVVFHLDSQNKISRIVFGLHEKTWSSIANNNYWPDNERFTIVNFLELFKTSYALKNIGLIESIFSDDALIITGRIVRVAPSEVNNFRTSMVEYNRQSKQEYINRLSSVFKSNEYINIRFEECIVKKSAFGSIYGIQLKQHYFSSNYGDEGYLFLIVDLNDKNNPIIHVRTWQPDIGSMDEMIGLHNF